MLCGKVEPAGCELPPVAPFLMQSLRSVGYTTSSALADIVDNSIAAGARTVDIRADLGPDPYVAVIDDGSGMDDQALVCAMRFGSRDSREARTGMDLGRFGLGLKTASLSQCRRLLVATLTADGASAVAAWDMDACERTGRWWLERPTLEALPEDLLDQLKSQGRGTAVIWSKLDRLTSSGGSDPVRAAQGAMLEAGEHLAMVFHRFLSGELVRGFAITLNGRPLPRLDPFLEGHALGQALHPESFDVEGHKVTVSPFVLPFPSRLPQSDLDAAGGRDSLKTGHGFYVYRGGRLVVPGGWFRIVPSDELVRLARVRVDVPVELDYLWKVDIRKTVAEPPAALRPHLRRVVGDVTLRSRRVYSHRGSARLEADRVPLWQRRDLRDGAAAWTINRDHPAVAAFAGPDDTIEPLLRLLETTLPLQDIHLHLSNDLPVADENVLVEADLEALASRILDAVREQPRLACNLLERLQYMDPFNRDPDMARRIAGRLRA